MKNLTRKTLGYSLLAALLVGTFAEIALAHHSYAMFNTSAVKVIRGTIAEYRWANPHVFIEVDVTENGKTVRYSIEGGGTNVLRREGWTSESFVAGDEVEMSIRPLRDGSAGGAFLHTLFKDGRELGKKPEPAP